MQDTAAHAKFKPYTRLNIQKAPQWERLPPEHQQAVDIVSRVLPFRVNAYVLDQLIDWDRIPCPRRHAPTSPVTARPTPRTCLAAG